MSNGKCFLDVYSNSRHVRTSTCMIGPEILKEIENQTFLNELSESPNLLGCDGQTPRF